MPVNIHGKQYTMVHERIQELISFCRENNYTWSVETDVVERFSTKIICFKCTVTLLHKGVEQKFTGHAEEVYGSTNINRTSALENAETSAVGRALAWAGFGSEESISSANEVQNAIAQQEKGVDISNIKSDKKPPPMMPKTSKAYAELEEMVNSVDRKAISKSEKHVKYLEQVEEQLNSEEGITRFHFNNIKKTFQQWKQTKPEMFKKEKK